MVARSGVLAGERRVGVSPTRPAVWVAVVLVMLVAVVVAGS